MTTPDVRVRLTAEGLADVVAALAKVRSESQKTGRDSIAGFAGFQKALSGVQSALAAIGASITIGAFFAFIKNASEAADDIAKLKQGIGGTIEGVAGLAAVSKLADVPVEKLRGAIGKFAQDSVAFERGAPGVEKFELALRHLGISADEFNNKGLAERVTLVAQRFKALPEGVERAALAEDLFGKKGQQLIPVLTNIANITPQVAARLNRLFSKDAVEEAAALNDAMKEFGITAQGVGIQITAGIAPPVIEALQLLEGGLSDNLSAWQRWGAEVGKVFATTLIRVEGLFDRLESFSSRLPLNIELVRRTFHAAGEADTDVDRRIEAELLKRLAANRQEFADRQKLRDDEIARINREQPAPVEPVAPELANKSIAALQKLRAEEQAALRAGDELAAQRIHQVDVAIASARKATSVSTEDFELSGVNTKQLERARQSAQDSIKRIESDTKAANANEKLLFEQGLETISQHFAERRRIVAEEAQQEIAVLERRRAAEAKLEDPKQSAAAVASTDAEISAKRAQLTADLAGIASEERDAITKNGDAIEAVLSKVAKARGDDHAEALREIRQEGAEFEKQLLAAGFPKDVAANLRAGVEQAFAAPIELKFALQGLDTQLADLDRQRNELEARAAAGVTTQSETADELLKIEKQRLVVLTQIAEKQEEFARANPENQGAQEDATAARARVAQQETAVASVETDMQRLAKGSTDAALGGFAQFFSSISNGFGDIAKDAASATASILASVNNLVSQLLAQKVVGALLGLFSGGGGGLGTLFGVENLFGGFAKGGLVRRVVSAPARALQRFARGGKVDGGPPTPGGSGRSDGGSVVRTPRQAAPVVLHDAETGGVWHLGARMLSVLTRLRTYARGGVVSESRLGSENEHSGAATAATVQPPTTMPALQAARRAEQRRAVRLERNLVQRLLESRISRAILRRVLGYSSAEWAELEEARRIVARRSEHREMFAASEAMLSESTREQLRAARRTIVERQAAIDVGATHLPSRPTPVTDSPRSASGEPVGRALVGSRLRGFSRVLASFSTLLRQLVRRERVSERVTDQADAELPAGMRARTAAAVPAPLRPDESVIDQPRSAGGGLSGTAVVGSRFRGFIRSLRIPGFATGGSVGQASGDPARSGTPGPILVSARRRGLLRMFKGPGGPTDDKILAWVAPGTFILSTKGVRRFKAMGQWSDAMSSLHPGPRHSRGGRELIPIRVSNGEIAVPPEIVRQPGVLEELLRINRGWSSMHLKSLGGFATGGLIESSAQIAASAGAAGGPGGEGGRGGEGGSAAVARQRFDATLTVGVEEGAVVRHIESSEGEKAIIRVIKRNPRALS